MPPTRTITLPTALVERLGTSKQSVRLRQIALSEATNDGKLLPVPPAKDRKAIPMAISEPELEQVRKAHARLPNEELGDAELIARLAVTHFAREDKLARTASTEAIPPMGEVARLIAELPGLDVRSHQVLAANSVESASKARKVAFCEAATGVGKSMVAAASAYWARSQGAVVVIAAPSHSQISQISLELKRLTEYHGAIDATRLYGRQEFVSEYLLADLIDVMLADPNHPLREDAARAQQWLEHQQEKPPLSDALSTPPWSVASLVESAPDFPVAGVRLTSACSESDAGAQAYTDTRDRAASAGIVLCTHAMLSLDLRARLWACSSSIPDRISGEDGERYARRVLSALVAADSGSAHFLPDYKYLVVDELHELEASVARAMSSQISLRSVVRNIERLGNRLPIGQNIAEANRALSRIQELSSSSGDIRLTSKQSNGFAPLKALLNAVEKTHKRVTKSALKSRAQSKAPDEIAQLTENLGVLRQMTKPTTSRATSISFSPIRAYPSALQGPTSVTNMLRLLWGRVIADGAFGAAGLSATLYLPRTNAAPSAAHLVSKLGLRPEWTSMTPPFTPAWVTQPVTLRIPARASLASLTPPRSTSDPTLFEAWHDAVSAAVSQTIEDAQGGTLVLCTSYATVDELNRRLSDRYGSRLIVQTQDSPFSALKQRYIDAALSGSRPVWLATGQAGTGLDLSPPVQLNIAAEQDVMLTDLVITRLPFGLSGSSTQEERKRRLGQAAFAEDQSGMLTLLRQWVGRLVRRPGIRDRNLWVYDARAFTHSTYQPSVAALLARYNNRESFHLRSAS